MAKKKTAIVKPVVQPAAKPRSRQAKVQESIPSNGSDPAVASLEKRLAYHQRQLMEAWRDVFDTYVDPDDAYWDDDSGYRWDTLGGTARHRSALPSQISSEAALAEIRYECRRLASENEFAINAHENRISYIVGTGHVYRVGAKGDEELSEEEVGTVQAIIDGTIETNRWYHRQQEMVRRLDRDGEVFIRYFVDGGSVRLRFIEPDQIYTPVEQSGDKANSFGIQTDPDDVETVLGYWVDGEWIEARDIQHRKANVDSNVKRGLPLMYPVRKNLGRAGKLLRNMSVVAGIQSAIAVIRKHGSASGSTIQSFRGDKADRTVTNTRTGRTTYHQQFAPGTILDTTAGLDYDFPAHNVNAAAFVSILQAELRAIASRLCMPEFMLSSDASNANYASTMVAEGPAVKMFQRMQWSLIEDDLQIMWRVLSEAANAGMIAPELLAKVEITATPPNVTSRDRLKEVQADVALVNARVMSRHEARVRNDLDPDQESDRIEDESAGSLAANPFAGMAGDGE